MIQCGQVGVALVAAAKIPKQLKEEPAIPSVVPLVHGYGPAKITDNEFRPQFVRISDTMSHKDILWVDIFVADLLFAKDLEDLDHVSNELPDKRFGYLTLILYGIHLEEASEVATVAVFRVDYPVVLTRLLVHILRDILDLRDQVERRTELDFVRNS